MEKSLLNRRDRARFLIVHPGLDNSFHRSRACRIAEEFLELGLGFDSCELARIPRGRFDLCLLFGLSEILTEGETEDARRGIESARQISDSVLSVTAKCVHGTGFQAHLHALRDLGIDGILDLGFAGQQEHIIRQAGLEYEFVFDGLTQRQLRESKRDDDQADRPIPWAHVGRQTPARVGLTARLVNHVSGQGFAYLPSPDIVSAPLGPLQMERILRRTQCYLWSGDDADPYLESERFWSSWQAGCLPIKIVRDDATLPDGFPFRSRIVKEEEVVERLCRLDFRAESAAFRSEYRGHPSLGDGLGRFLADRGWLDDPAERPRPLENRAYGKCA